MGKFVDIGPMAGAVLFVCGCTTSLEVTKVDPNAAPPPQQVSYSLPFQQFDFTATRIYMGCDKFSTPTMQLKVSATPVSYVPVATSTGTSSGGSATTTTTPAPVPSPDPEQTYAIDPQTLDSWTKISDLKINYVVTNGATTLLLSSVNAAAEDRTAQIITNILTTAASIATTVASGGVGAKAVVQPKCTPDPTYEQPRLAQKALDDRVKVATARVERSTARLNVITKLAGNSATKLDSETSGLMIRATEELTAATKAQTDATKAAAENQKKFTVTTTFRWPATGALAEDGAQQVLVPGGSAAAAHFNISAPSQYFSTSLRLEQVPTGLKSPARPISGQKSGELKGLRYRTPVPGRLIVCAASTASAPPDAPVEQSDSGVPKCGALQPPSPDVIMSDGATPIWTGMAGQLGQVRALAYSNGVFQNNTFAATFNADGGLSSVEYAAKTSRGETFTGALASSAGGAASIFKGIMQGRLDQLNYQNNLNTAKSNLVTSQANLSTVDQIAVIQANTNLVKAQSAYEDAQAALIKSTANLKTAQGSP